MTSAFSAPSFLTAQQEQ